MANFGIGNTVASNLSNTVKDVVVNPLNTDGATGQEEYTWQSTDWPMYWGYFNDISELKNVLITKSIWVVGKGYTADPETTVILDHITGWGKDTFKDILFNLDLISRLNGDSYAEIILDEETGLLLNLKVLDPGSIRIVVDSKGIILRYEQVSKIPLGFFGKAAAAVGLKKRESVITFDPDKIFHLSHNRFADQIHGISDVRSLKKVIDADNEYFTDMRKIQHRQARPFIMFMLDTDDVQKIAAFKNTADAALNLGENLYVPMDKNVVSHEVIKVDISPVTLQWGDSIRQRFYRSMGLPLTVFGAASGNESQSKIEYLAHEQIFSNDQKFLEEQIWNQLFLRIKLVSPVTLLENLQQDQSKDANQGIEFQPNDVTAGSGA